MQIKLIQRKDIDSQKWDACVCQNGHGIIYGLSWFLDCLTESSWSAFIIEDYRAVLPFYPKTKYFIPYISQPVLCRYFQVYGDTSAEAMLISFALNYFKTHSFKTNINIRLYTKPDWESVISYEEKFFQQLSLEPVYVDLEGKFDRNTKRNLRHANTCFIEISNSDEMSNLEFIFEHDPSAYLKHHRNAITKICRAAIERKVGYFLIATTHSKVVGVSFFIEYGQEILFLLNAMNPEGRQYNVSFAAIDHIIKIHAGSGKILDFGGSSIQNIARRNLGFGSDTISYRHYFKSFLQ
ncbi:MAG: hypothetical protein KDC04_00055 [Saprospiraceae bacterium]|nr:hypothetical protein [Saprospiraceae bacterium]